MLANTAVSRTHCAVKQALNIQLRPYQEDARQGLYYYWDQGALNVCVVLPTGAGKTILFGRVIADHPNIPICAIAHRQELVTQISLALAKYGIRHDILAPKNVISHIVKLHVSETGLSYYTPKGKVRVAGVDTLKARRSQPEIKKWANTVRMWVQDECHHILKSNKWGKACDMFPNAKGLGVTATPERSDGYGLGRHADGVFDEMYVGITLRDLIDQGYLTDYKIFAPPSDIDFTNLKKGSNGDYTSQELRKREVNSHIVGDVVKHYHRIMPGRLAVTFASNVKSAHEFANEFNKHGVPAATVSGATKDSERIATMSKFARKEILNCTNVDIFGEGYDLPAIDGVQMVRKTASFGLFVQQAGRALRPVYAKSMPLDTVEQRKAAIAAGGKPIAYIIDHVGNVERHAVFRNGVIDLAYREWTLDRKKKDRRDSEEVVIPIKNCVNPECGNVYDGSLPACPYCNEAPKPADRSEPKFVEGDLTELDPSVLKRIDDKVEAIKNPTKIFGNDKTSHAIRYKQEKRRKAQETLTNTINQWGGYHRALGHSDRQALKLFWFEFRTDVKTARTLTADQMVELNDKILLSMEKLHDEYARR